MIKNFYYLKKNLIFLSVIFYTFTIATKEVGDIQLKIGNFALPSSQQPGPLLGFGQNIIDEHDLQLFIFPDFLFGKKNKKLTEVNLSLLYAIKDNLSIFFELPIAASFHSNGQTSSGVEDFLIQLEYAPYSYETSTSLDQITFVTSLFLPSGSDRKTPPTGFGSPSFFIGFTAAHTATDLYYYLSDAVLLTTQHNNHTKVGNQFIYQAGIGKNIAYSSDKWIFTWMIELSGVYSQKNKINGVIDQDSGGNRIILGPSLWFSTERFILQGGIAPVISEHLFGQQTKNIIFIAFNVGLTF